MGFRNGQTNELLALEDLRDDPCLELFASKVQDGRQADNLAGQHP